MPNTRYIATLQRIKEFKDITHYDVSLMKETTEGSTLGTFKIIDTQDNKELFNCFSLENAGESTDKQNIDKRIMPRVYRLKWAFTGTSQGLHKGGEFRGRGLSEEEAKEKIFEKYKEFVEPNLHQRYLQWGFRNLGCLVWCETKPSFENRSVFIHNGNYPQDTRGCILLGYNDNKNGTIGDSSRCIEDFNKLVLVIGVENLSVEIKEIS